MDNFYVLLKGKDIALRPRSNNGSGLAERNHPNFVLYCYGIKTSDNRASMYDGLQCESAAARRKSCRVGVISVFFLGGDLAHAGKFAAGRGYSLT